MDVIYNSCCVINVHKNKLVACLKVKGKKNVIKEYGGQTEDIKNIADWLQRRVSKSLHKLFDTLVPVIE